MGKAPATGYFYGPAMRKLNPRQRCYIIAYRDLQHALANGADRPTREGIRTQAARAAGYSGSNDDLRTTAWRLMHDPLVQDALKEVAFTGLAAEAVYLSGILSDIATGVIPATPSEKLRAIGMIFNRIGMHEKTSHEVTVTHTITNDEALEKIKQFAGVIGVDPFKLLGHAGIKIADDKIIDAEFEEVEDEIVI